MSKAGEEVLQTTCGDFDYLHLHEFEIYFSPHFYIFIDMGKCKNIECNNETKKGRVYCSLTCRNVYVNKHLRDYSKNVKSIKKSTDVRRESYMVNPRKCGCCGENLPYNKRHNKYCNSSCAAKVINKGRVGLKYELSDEGLENLKKSALRLSNTTQELLDSYENEPNRCDYCGDGLPYNKRHNKYCTIECRKTHKRKNIEEYRQYQFDCKFNFNLADYENEFNFGLIEEHGWYSPSNSRKPNIKGVSRDHIFSVSEGYKQGVNPKIISHPANCRLMVHCDNISKGGNCSITIEELINKIEKWDKKHLL